MALIVKVKEQFQYIGKYARAWATDLFRCEYLFLINRNMLRDDGTPCLKPRVLGIAYLNFLPYLCTRF